MIKAIAVNSNPSTLKTIEDFSKKTDTIVIQKTFTEAADALKFLRKYPVDLLYLDMQMPAISGVDFFQSVEQSTKVIFTASNNQFAVHAFDMNAIDYLVTPLTYNRFQQAADKAAKSFSYENKSENKSEQSLFVRADYKLIKINIADILYIEGLCDYIKIYINNQKTIITRIKMKAIEEKLHAKEFVRVHRSFIVPFHRIENAQTKMISIAGKSIPVGDSYKKAFLKMFQS